MAIDPKYVAKNLSIDQIISMFDENIIEQWNVLYGEDEKVYKRFDFYNEAPFGTPSALTNIMDYNDFNKDDPYIKYKEGKVHTMKTLDVLRFRMIKLVNEATSQAIKDEIERIEGFADESVVNLWNSYVTAKIEVSEQEPIKKGAWFIGKMSEFDTFMSDTSVNFKEEGVLTKLQLVDLGKSSTEFNASDTYFIYDVYSKRFVTNSPFISNNDPLALIPEGYLEEMAAYSIEVGS